MSEHPLLLVALIGAAVYLGHLWWSDYRRPTTDPGGPPPLPGATAAPRRIIMLAVAGSCGLLAVESWGEYQLGIVGEQSTLTVLAAIHTLGAVVIEELIFRGFLVINGRGPWARWAGILGASVLFALAHPFLWTLEGGFALTLTVKGTFSTGAAFVFSLWFYFLRFNRWNPAASLLPCFAGHAAKNLGVIAIKGAQGFLVGWW
ncbi:MAG: type II CAAX prenyl endopeptidase Rce1 family protein [Cephaloticoccus sp.]